jgi:dTDP-4-amino-4,6-dideoxygalactose transaminase
VIGINSRLDSFQAALLAIKLQSLPAWTTARQTNAARYHELFAGEGLEDLIVVPQSLPECEHVWNQFTIRVPGGRRDEIRQQLAEQKIGSEVYYPIPLHRQVCFAYLGYEVGSLPETERACGEVLSLPIFPGLLASEQEMVVETLAGLLRAGQSVRRAA